MHVAHGADAVCFFQWRQSAAGAEKYHSAMVPHAGPDSAVFRSVSELGRTLEAIAPIAGTEREPACVALLFDWDSWWASEQDSHPTSRLDHHREALDWYSALLRLGIRADVVPAHRTDLSSYDVVIAPVLHMVSRPFGTELTRYVEGGGHLVTTYRRTLRGRLASPEDIAHLALFLFFGVSANITGQVMVGDGGWTADGYAVAPA